MFRIRLLQTIMAHRECIRSGTVLHADRCGETNNYRAHYKGHTVILFGSDGSFELIG
jgi:hypothetical protein